MRKRSRSKAMRTIRYGAIAVALAAIGFAAPAGAQPYGPGYGPDAQRN